MSNCPRCGQGDRPVRQPGTQPTTVRSVDKNVPKTKQVVDNPVKARVLGTKYVNK